MKKFLPLAFFMFFCCALLTAQGYKPGAVKWTAGPESMPENLKAFQENKGQFINTVNSWKVLYGTDYQGSRILFTDHGVIYFIPEVIKNAPEDKDAEEGEKEQEEKQHKKVVLHTVSMEWAGMNTGFSIEADNKTPYYFGSFDPQNPTKGIDSVKGYQKLVYHNIYPGIDVEYTFHADKGIEYAVKVKAGYSAGLFKMDYSGQQNLSIDNTGNIYIGTAMGDIIDHAPVTTQNGNTISSSFKKTNDNEISFQLGSIDNTSDLVIDPWVVTPTTGNFLPQDVGMDAANNTYILGMTAAGASKIQKYTTTGALSWTYSLTQYGSPGYVSDLAVDQAGDTYAPMPYPSTNSLGNYYALISLNTAGTLRYFDNTDPTPYGKVYEVWNIAYSCNYSELIEAGAPTVEQEEVGVVNSANGSLGGVTTNATYGEIYAGCIAPNGNYYAIAANPCFGCSTPGDDIVCYTVSGGTATFSWNKQSTYQWNDFDSKNPNGISTNGIAAGCAYLYTTDGLTLDQRDINNGNVLNTATVTGGSNALSASPGGVAVDLACGYVYVGSNNSTVYVYNQTLGLITTQGVSGPVYDVDFNNGLVAACGGTSGNGFVTQFAAQTCVNNLIITRTNTTCGNNNGTATVQTPTFCAPPYTYTWSTGATTQTVTGLAAGTYTVNVGTATSCVTVTDTVNIRPSTPVTETATATSGGCTGTVTATVTGGEGPYTYSWSSGQTTSSITGIGSGTYTCTITDAYGCVQTANATVTGTTMSITITPVNDLCNGGNNGSATANITGGTAPYTYAWGGGQTTSSITGLTANTYSVTVTESGGCSGTATINITQPAAMVITTTSTPSTCGAANGSAGVTSVTGGTGPYTYSWNSGQTTSTIANVVAASYTVTVTDANGCTQTATVIVATAGAAVTPTMAFTNVTCNGAANGTGSVTGVGGGTAPYTYLWSNSTSATTTNVAALPPGTYTVTVTDHNGCTGTGTVTITQPAAMVVNTTSTPSACTSANGTAGVTSVTGGTGPYTYSWSSGQLTSSITNVASGSYTVTVKDANGCTQPATVVVGNVGATVTPTVTSTNVLCFGGNSGTAGVTTVTGGTGPYTYSWSSGQLTSTIGGLVIGPYTATVTDANGCSGTASVTITQPSQLRDSITTITNELCFGSSIGTISVGVKDGTPGYTYSWNSNPVQTTQTATGLPAGNYIVTITDGNGCTIQANGTISQPAQLIINAAAFPVSCHGLCNGQLVCIPSGGTTPYGYLWSNGVTAASDIGVCPGTYSIQVTDANGCVADSTGLIVTQPTAVTGTTTIDSTHCGQSDGGACITAAGGTPGYTYAWSTGATTTCITNELPVTYTVIITDANKCNDTVTVTVPNAPGDSAGITATTAVTCNGGNNGTATAGGYHGMPPYTYSWNTAPPQATQTATGLSAGPYTVTVTDANGCSSTAVATITQPPLVIANPPPPQTICIGQSALLNMTAGGGTPGYTFTWMPGNMTGPSATVSPVVTTTYSITTVDVNGCPGAQVTVVVTVNPPLSVKVVPNQATCPGGSVTLGAIGSGGDGTYTYTWTPATNLSCTVCQSPTATPIATTVYTVTLTDGCGTPPVTGTVQVTIDPLPAVKFVADTLQGCSPLCVNFTDQTTIASAGIASWAWTFGDGGKSTQQNPSYCYNNPGIFTVDLTVKSDSGCVDSLTIPNMITVYSHPVAAFTYSPQPASIVNPTINFVDESTDVYGIASWFWQFGDLKDGTSTLENPQYIYGDTGTYCPTLVVTNIHGCTDTAQHCLIIEPYYTLYIPNAFSPNGDGLNDVFAPKGIFVCSFQMYIFDRWGMMLYYTEDMNKGWDGRVNGGANIAQEDTYVYLIEATDCVTKDKHQYLGKVTIVK